ncbi:hypothetical protein CDD80_201 [Ophiocordyceps camponoti-rufipedis]|uniref:polynucleotide adenylyltransferase n=1 Tax=Ophiocordyceps camponoti-rufipedis TaxID=2004952 RepID=A0A2C5YKN1_9HYPO|nr:hypothetical protein CDD80_201 [Ophiocordyceps camponoti-rufipedis]
MSRNEQRPRRDRRDEDHHRRHRRRSPPPPLPPSYNSWRPGAPRHDAPYRGSDSYRPRPPQGSFDFRVEKPPGIGSLPPAGLDRRSDPPARRRPQRNPGRPRWQPPNPSERALTSGAAFSAPGVSVREAGAANKFRNLEDLSDDDEVDMEMSSQSSSGGAQDQKPSVKRARTAAKPDADAAPKWSNPDPYTALPCPDETSTRPKRDVVKLIRKARLEEPKPSTDVPAAAKDFIPFDMSSDEESKPEPNMSRAPLSFRLPAKPPAPSRSQALDLDDGSGDLGSRKRTADDRIKPPDYGQSRKADFRPSKGVLLPEWQPVSGEDRCPWATIELLEGEDMSDRQVLPFKSFLLNAQLIRGSDRLHKEVMEFYEFTRPREFEHVIRARLVEKLAAALRRDQTFRDGRVKPFGSFVSGLYLPTADMDLVVCSQTYLDGGPALYLSKKRWLYSFKQFLVASGIAQSGSVTVIAHARVPLVKFVDKITGLKVDVSFENLGGVQAVDTFLAWKREYPEMPILVTIIKHFLLMRGLNEPVSGGIGGFSVICLVVSMLQMMSPEKSKNLRGLGHLGDLLLHFFDLYGRRFEYRTLAISLTRPVGYIKKSEVKRLTYKNPNRLSIIDPNNPSNDISGGSSNTPAILARFNDASVDLRKRMTEVSQQADKGSILGVILEGNYSSFKKQRQYLKQVHEEKLGPCYNQEMKHTM